jgi:hypothetical protein
LLTGFRADFQKPTTAIHEKPAARGSSPDFLSEAILKVAGKRQLDVSGQCVVLLSKSEKHPAMLKDVADRAQIPEGRYDEGDLAPRDAVQLAEKGVGIFDVLDGMGAEGVLEFPRRKWKRVDIVHHDEPGNIRVIDDVDIDSASIRFSAADIEIPLLPPPSNDTAHDTITEKIECRQENKSGSDGDKKVEEHGGSGRDSFGKAKESPKRIFTIQAALQFRQIPDLRHRA